MGSCCIARGAQLSKKDSECDVAMEEGSQAADWDSDETVVEGSVTESDPEEEALPWRR